MIKLHLFSEFYDQYFKFVKTGITQIEAYEKTELLYRKTFGCNKYANYKSFRRVYERKVFSKR